MRLFENISLASPGPRNLFLAQLLSQVGDKIWLVAAIWYLANSNDPKIVPWFLALSALPHLLLVPVVPRLISFLGGELSTVIRTDWIRGIAFILLGVFWTQSSTSTASLFAVSILSNVLGSLFNPAILSLPRLVSEEENIQSTTALVESCFSISAVFGPILATGLYATSGLKGVMILNGLSYCIAAAIERFVTTRKIDTPTEVKKNSKSLDPTILFMLLGFLFMNLFLGPVMVFIPLFAKQVYVGTIGSLASLETALGVGTLAGTVILSLRPMGGAKQKKILLGIVAVSFSYLVFSLSRGVLVGVVGLGLLGLSLAMTNVWILDVFQTKPAPDEVLSVMSWVNLISVASLPFSMSLIAVLLTFTDVKVLSAICAVVLLFMTIGASVTSLVVGTR